MCAGIISSRTEYFYRQVESDSSVCADSGLIVAIIIVLQFPPRLSLCAHKIKLKLTPLFWGEKHEKGDLSTEVIIEFLYGICCRPLVAFSCSALMTISR